MGSDSPAGGAAHAAQEAGGRGATGGLSSARAQRECDVPPRLEVRRRARQMQNHAADRADDVDPQLQQPVPQPRHLAAGTRSTRRPQSQFLHEHVGRGGQEDAQLVRREQTAARAVDLQPIEQFLDPILDVPASTVDLLIDEARRLPQIRHHEPRVVPRLAVSEANDFGLDHDPALVVPRAGGVAGVGIDVRGLATDLALRASHLHGGLRMPLQTPRFFAIATT